MLSRTVPVHVVFAIVSMLALLAVLVLSFMPSEAADRMRLRGSLPVDIGHVLAYAVLAGATMLAAPRQALNMRRGVCIVFATSIVGVAIELLQPLVRRTGAIMDVVGNEVGIASGIAVARSYLLIDKVRSRDSNRSSGDE